MQSKAIVNSPEKNINFLPSKDEALQDYYICVLSREASVLARKEVLSGRANFGIIGDGKELAQVAMAKAWKKGDFRSGYYRDQTLMFALGISDLVSFFSQLYGDPENDPFSKGRQMNCHFATPFIDKNGNWTKHKEMYNISSDIASTGGQMARGLGLAFASKKYREYAKIQGDFSNNGNEVAFCTIGDASTSEGVFWESVNAAGVLQVPLAISVWDDGYGISVPKKYQTTKESISDILMGFTGDDLSGMDIHTAKAWNYMELCNTYIQGVEHIRKHHRPALFHIQEVTQQLGHSTSGDHRRYKSEQRLQFEKDFDCNVHFRNFIIEQGFALDEDLKTIEQRAKSEVTEAGKLALKRYQDRVKPLYEQLTQVIHQASAILPENKILQQIQVEITQLPLPLHADMIRMGRRALFQVQHLQNDTSTLLKQMVDAETARGEHWYSTDLYSHSPKSALKVIAIPAEYASAAPLKDGYEILNACFDANFEKYPNTFAFGEDVGQIGDVNQGMRGLQEKYGKGRIFDTGIREWTIMGQAIGMAMRGMRPIAEIQYIDYLLYGLTPLSDDLATLRYRSGNLQMAPAIIRTRGHRLVGIWHSGSPMGLMISSLRGMYICVPRNMVQAAGMYNTLLQSDDPAILVECLNGYRLKEKLPSNIGEFTVPLGVPEVLQIGADLTIITYGSCVRIAQDAIALASSLGVSIELIDVQTLIPFDLENTCLESIKKTNRVIFLDEDHEGGASGYMMQQVLQKQGGFRYLDAAPITVHSKDHRPAYGQDGDYFSKPQPEDVYEAIVKVMEF